MFVLDTNHVSELTYRTAPGSRLLQQLDAADQAAAAPIHEPKSAPYQAGGGGRLLVGSSMG